MLYPVLFLEKTLIELFGEPITQISYGSFKSKDMLGIHVYNPEGCWVVSEVNSLIEYRLKDKINMFFDIFGPIKMTPVNVKYKYIENYNFQKLQEKIISIIDDEHFYLSYNISRKSIISYLKSANNFQELLTILGLAHILEPCDSKGIPLHNPLIFRGKSISQKHLEKIKSLSMNIEFKKMN